MNYNDVLNSIEYNFNFSLKETKQILDCESNIPAQFDNIYIADMDWNSVSIEIGCWWQRQNDELGRELQTYFITATITCANNSQVSTRNSNKIRQIWGSITFKINHIIEYFEY